MKNMWRQVSRSPKFIVGACIFGFILLWVFIYPFLVPGHPLEMIGRNSFIRPGVYVSLYDSVNAQQVYTIILSEADQRRIEYRLSWEDRERMKEWLVMFGLPEHVIDIENTEMLLMLWRNNFDAELRLGATAAERQFFNRLDTRIYGLLETPDMVVMEFCYETNDYVHAGVIRDTDFVHVGRIANVRFLPLGTDNFGRDVLKQMMAAVGVSLTIGLIAGLVATLIGLILGLIAGYIGGIVDDIIMFFTNLFTVIPGFVLLILISFSIGQAQRGAMIVAIVIGLTSWVWTTRAVRSQVMSLRNRDHVNLSKLSGHSLPRIVANDILPYIASYVIMAFILQISSAILAEAQLSMLGLGPMTTETPTLGIMMNWAMTYSAHINGAWWAYFPIIIVIALISFSLNLMNTGLDQVFNPQLRD